MFSSLTISAINDYVNKIEIQCREFLLFNLRHPTDVNVALVANQFSQGSMA